MIKAAFFDIDGTLVSLRTHRIPASAAVALEQMRARGISIIVASGRPRYQLGICSGHGFDAFITLNGQLCYDAAGIYRAAPIDARDARVIVDHVLAGRYDAIALQAQRGFANRESASVRAMCRKVDFEYRADDFGRALDEPVYQFCAFVEPGAERDVLSGTHTLTHTRWTELFCDILPTCGGKAAGVAATLKRMGIDAKEAVAFGDGGNDIDMFDAVGTSVAMGNASDEVKRHADHVAPGVDEDGLYRAALELDLI
ncbi:Cof-like hydrolase [Coriobacterium glomerans PW2]|uniref:Cof-like hydrolase n=1 Tax=Coriobacterium glomerans (strain ATCC 49209 / DSM 20642 / JCM 10262 / PW2) TaxID=700015 RepID=F2NBK9_CORGP|nr:Cof-type HAD-IIB family hydrolase [Coriobacterium glomerans]AEB06745.1 Cof-like hydrolase [Coriobacterium glomerans PW2]